MAPYPSDMVYDFQKCSLPSPFIAYQTGIKIKNFVSISNSNDLFKNV